MEKYTFCTEFSIYWHGTAAELKLSSNSKLMKLKISMRLQKKIIKCQKNFSIKISLSSKMKFTLNVNDKLLFQDM